MSGNVLRLQHLFWKYIDKWQDRVKILVSLGLLPMTIVQIPLSLEQMAIKGAESKKKLYELWNEVMLYVPKPQRRPNPFPKNA
jgi:hypothetical protein